MAQTYDARTERAVRSLVDLLDFLADPEVRPRDTAEIDVPGLEALRGILIRVRRGVLHRDRPFRQVNLVQQSLERASGYLMSLGHEDMTPLDPNGLAEDLVWASAAYAETEG